MNPFVYQFFAFMLVKLETNLFLRGIVCRYAQYGEVSTKVDVYAFGVVLYELISAREAIVKTNEEVTESMGLIALVFIN